jgi:hypothetical protein
VILKGTVKLLYIFHLEESKNFTLCDWPRVPHPGPYK